MNETQLSPRHAARRYHAALMQPVPAPSRARRVCRFCGVVAPAAPASGACELCRRPLAETAVWVDDSGDAFWVAVRARFQCSACEFLSPLDSLDVDGAVQCAHCGVDRRFEPESWTEPLTLRARRRRPRWPFSRRARTARAHLHRCEQPPRAGGRDQDVRVPRSSRLRERARRPRFALAQVLGVARVPRVPNVRGARAGGHRAPRGEHRVRAMRRCRGVHVRRACARARARRGDGRRRRAARGSEDDASGSDRRRSIGLHVSHVRSAALLAGQRAHRSLQVLQCFVSRARARLRAIRWSGASARDLVGALSRALGFAR